mmetsp:Transcript_58872/g.172302  ORF Transcript_58872/g.172302 Transcript_58872/m.172302 type:complete len:631 (-) Transcript_58872:53-1945(-)
MGGSCRVTVGCVAHLCPPSGCPTMLVLLLLLLLLVLYQAMLIPVELAFVERMALAEPRNPMWCVEFAMGVLFSLDVLLSCVTAHIRDDGIYVRRQWLILRNYAVTPPFFLLIDLAALAPFLISFADFSSDVGSESTLSTAGESARYLRYMRLFRLLRLLRLTRAFKVTQVVSKVTIVKGRYMVAALGVTKLLLGFFFCAHLGACAWRALSLFDHHARTQSVDVSNVWESYTFAFWWMITSLGAGSPPLSPTAGWERWIWSFFSFLAICVVTVTTGMLVQILDRFNEDVQELDQKLRVASKFISRHPVPDHVKARVFGAVRTSFQQQRDRGRFQELVDPLLSEDLRRKVYGSIYGSVMRWFPPLKEKVVPARFLATLAVEAMIERYGQSDIILHEGMVEDSMIFILEGNAMLHSVEKRMKLPVVSKWFLGERALFWDPGSGELEPLRSASLTALTPCEVLVLESAAFHRTVQNFGLSAWLEHHRRRWPGGGWGCPACGKAGHWLDECSTLVAAEEGAALAHELRPVREAALRNFLRTIRSSHRAECAKSEEREAVLPAGGLEGPLGRLLEEARAAREQLAAAGERVAALEKAAKELAEDPVAEGEVAGWAMTPMPTPKAREASQPEPGFSL